MLIQDVNNRGNSVQNDREYMGSLSFLHNFSANLKSSLNSITMYFWTF